MKSFVAAIRLLRAGLGTSVGTTVKVRYRKHVVHLLGNTAEANEVVVMWIGEPERAPINDDNLLFRARGPIIAL